MGALRRAAGKPLVKPQLYGQLWLLENDPLSQVKTCSGKLGALPASLPLQVLSEAGMAPFHGWPESLGRHPQRHPMPSLSQYTDPCSCPWTLTPGTSCLLSSPEVDLAFPALLTISVHRTGLIQLCLPSAFL